MAEKEERILITKVQPKCKFRELHETTAGGHTWVDFMCGKSTVKNLECDEKCFEQCEWKELTGISRTEAICKIGRAICRAGGNECIGDCESCDSWEVGPEKDYAETALNALLEDK